VSLLTDRAKLAAMSRWLVVLGLLTACGTETSSAAPGSGSGSATRGTGSDSEAGSGSGSASPATRPGYGVGHGGRPKDPDKLPTLTLGEPTVDHEAALDKAIVRRYIKRHFADLSYCYERQMTTKAGLAGTVSARFKIGLDGLVVEAAATGVDPDVSRCVADVIHGIEFPKPHGDAVKVSYPISFAPPKSPPASTVAAPSDKGMLGIIEEKNLKLDGSPPVDGELTAAMIDQPIRHEHARFQACYEAVRKTKPALQGKVVARFKIEPDGKVSKHEAHGLDDAVDACVDGVIASIRFPASTGGANVSYPFTFKPE